METLGWSGPVCFCGAPLGAGHTHDVTEVEWLRARVAALEAALSELLTMVPSDSLLRRGIGRGQEADDYVVGLACAVTVARAALAAAKEG